MTPKEQKIFDMQAPSYREAMSQSEEKRAELRLTPIGKNAQVLDENGNVFLNHRPISFMEAQIEHKCRYERGARIAEMRSEEDAKSFKDDKRQSAINAFMD